MNKRYERNSKLSAPTKGAYAIIKVNKNETVVIKRNQYHETINIRRICPFKEKENNDE